MAQVTDRYLGESGSPSGLMVRPTLGLAFRIVRRSYLPLTAITLASVVVFATIATLALLAYGPSLMAIGKSASGGNKAATVAGLQALGVGIFAIAFGLSFVLVVVGALWRAACFDVANEAAKQRALDFGRAAKAAFGRVWAMIGLGLAVFGIFFVLGVAFAIVCAVLAGIAYATRGSGAAAMIVCILLIAVVALGAVFAFVKASVSLACAFPVCVLERKGPIDSIKRSFHLASDEFWRIATIQFALGLMASVVSLATTLLAGLAGGAPHAVLLAIHYALVGFLGACGPAVSVAIYRNLRFAKGEGRKRN